MVQIDRLVKFNTGATQRFAPRSANRTEIAWAGPFRLRSRAEQAVLSTLGTHTCLSAVIVSEDFIRDELAKGMSLTTSRENAFKEALRLVEDAATTVEGVK